MYTAASFFSGIGGIDLAFSWSGFDIRFQCEIDEYCQQVLKKHAAQYWSNAKLRGDIKNVTKADVGYVDVMFGGFPCQDISIAGKQAGVTEGNRSGLWFELLRIIGEVRPRVILLENVANISMVGGLTVTATLAKIGYDAIWLPIRAADVGAPHRRERWFCVAYANCKRPPSKLNKPCWERRSHNTTRARGQLGNAKRQRLEGRKLYTGRFAKPRRRQKRKQSAGIKSRLGRVDSRLPDRLDRHNGQFPARPNEQQFDFEPPRITDRREHRVKRLKALGNAVVPQQVLPIAQAIKVFLDKASKDEQAQPDSSD